MKDYSLRTTPTFIHQALLIARAIPDAVLIFRGASCIHEKLDQTLRSHDWSSDYSAGDGGDRILATMDPYTVSVTGTEDLVYEAVDEALRRVDVGIVLLAELSRITITGESLEGIAASVRRRFGLPCAAITSRGFGRDWTDAFSGVLAGMAGEIDFSSEDPTEKETVAIVGYTFSRFEGDSLGDVEELERLVAATGCRPLPVWLSGEPWQRLCTAARADKVIALPGGEAAAAFIAEKAGARLVNLPLPVSIAGTREWLESVARGLDVRSRAQEWIETELERLVSALDRCVTSHLVGKKAAVVATGEWLPGIVRCFEEDLGIRVVCQLQRSRREAGKEMAVAVDSAHLPDRLFDPSVMTLNRHLREAIEGGGVDFIVGSNWERNALGPELRSIPFLEFGFPCLQAHFLTSRAHLGFAGVLTWAERIYDLLSAAE